MSLDATIITISELQEDTYLKKFMRYPLPSHEIVKREFSRIKDEYSRKSDDCRTGVQKNKLKRLEATADLLTKEIKETKDGIIYFPFDEVRKGVQAECQNDKEGGTSESSIKGNIQLILNQFKVEQKVENLNIKYKFVAVYRQGISYIFHDNIVYQKA